MPNATYDIDLFQRSVAADPFPLYEEMRARGNVVWNGTMQAWMAVGFNECREVLTDNGERFAEMNTAEMTPWFDGGNMIVADGPEHDRLRRALAPYFTRQEIAAWEQRVADVIDELLDPLLAQGTFDIVADFTKIPTIIVAQMMGIPKERYGDFQRWSHNINTNLSYGNETPETRASLNQTGVEANAYLEDEIARHAEQRPDDLLLRMMDSGDMSHPELRSTALLLVLAGYDTTAKLLSNSLVVLAAHPEQRQAIIDDLSLLPAAVEEIMRFTGPTQMNVRQMAKDTTLGGEELKAGDRMFVLQTAANRDPSRWDDPLRFDIRREAKASIAFGFGPHLCLGASLARLEVTTALRKLLVAAPNYTLRDVDYGTGMLVRGPEKGFIDVNG
jgi:cytochrome P450